MQTLEKAARTAFIEGKNWRKELFTFLGQYRVTPHSTTRKSLPQLLNRRKRKCTLLRVQNDQSAPEVRQLMPKEGRG